MRQYFLVPGQAQFSGVLGAALTANRTGRLSKFIRDEHSPAIALFRREHARQNTEGDWYGEHAGKYLYAAARAAHRAGDEPLQQQVCRVADYLVSMQEADGYLGTYAASHRFMQPLASGAPTWDGAPCTRTWDIWIHSYLVLGLLEVHRLFDRPHCLDAARKIGDLCLHTFSAGGIDVTRLGNHHGMSATVMLDPAVELFLVTGEVRYLELAELILQQADERDGLGILRQALAGTDVAEISTGKAYQLCWNFVGIAKLFRATGKAPYLAAVTQAWDSIRAHHLTLGGGPWGGVGHRSREVFNHPSVFSPHAYVETCSVLAWMQLNRELLAITGEAKYAEELERSAYNDLLGAQAPNGEDWCYYSFPNGKRVHTTYWRCCKSSGAIALEELALLACTVRDDGTVAVNLYSAGVSVLSTSQTGKLRIEQQTAYPFDGAICLQINPQHSVRFALALRIPAWASDATIHVNDEAWPAVAGSFARIERLWQAGDEVRLDFPMVPVLQHRSSFSNQESRGPLGESIAQEVMRYDYVAVTRGPLVYATDLIDGFKTQETLLVDGALQLEMEAPPLGFEGPAIRMTVASRPPLLFLPYFEAGGRHDGGWRLTWMQVVTAPGHAGGPVAADISV